MPPLRHSVPGVPFDIFRSDFVNWLIAQPEVREWLYNKARYSGRVIYSPETGFWRGSTHEETEGVLAHWRKENMAAVRARRKAKLAAHSNTQPPQQPVSEPRELDVPRSSALFKALAAHSEIIDLDDMP